MATTTYKVSEPTSGDEVVVTVKGSGELAEMVRKDLLELNMTDWSVTLLKPKTMYVLVDEVNSQVFGPFSSEKAAINAARTGDECVGGEPWGEYGWNVCALTPIED
jgi:hypothetical protein